MKVMMSVVVLVVFVGLLCGSPGKAGADFSMIIASDTHVHTGGQKIIDDNFRHAMAMHNLIMGEQMDALTWDDGSYAAQVKGVIINGDLTNYGKEENFDMFDAIYGVVPGRIFPGLGNHDIGAQVIRDPDTECHLLSLTCDAGCYNNGCAAAAVDWMEDEVLYMAQNYGGSVSNFSYYWPSLSYSWDMGSYHFVQLNINSQYAAQIQRVAHADRHIYDSVIWLYADVSMADARGKKTVILLHDDGTYNTTNPFYHDYLNPMDLWEATLLDFNVVAIFAGHKHKAQKRPDITVENTATGESRDILHFRSGCAYDSTPDFLFVEFSNNEIKWSKIDTSAGAGVPLPYVLTTNQIDLSAYSTP